MNRGVLNLFGGVAAVVGFVGSYALMTTFSSSRSSSPSPQSPITCTATIPASQAGGKTEVVFTENQEGDGYDVDTTRLRRSQTFQIIGTGNSEVAVSVLEAGQQYKINPSTVGEVLHIKDLENAGLLVAENGEFTYGIKLSELPAFKVCLQGRHS